MSFLEGALFFKCGEASARSFTKEMVGTVLRAEFTTVDCANLGLSIVDWLEYWCCLWPGEIGVPDCGSICG